MITDADILVDIDKKDVSAEEIAERMFFISVFTPFDFTRIRVRETAKGFHIYLWCADIKPTPVDKVVIQLILGSDYRRELFNYLRVCGRETPRKWNVLFATKYDGNGNKISRERTTDKSIRLEEEIYALYHTLMEEGGESGGESDGESGGESGEEGVRDD